MCVIDIERKYCKVVAELIRQLVTSNINACLILDIDERDTVEGTMKSLLRVSDRQQYYEGNIQDFIMSHQMSGTSNPTVSPKSDIMSEIRQYFDPLLKKLGVVEQEVTINLPTDKQRVQALIDALETYKYTLKPADLKEFT